MQDDLFFLRWLYAEVIKRSCKNAIQQGKKVKQPYQIPGDKRIAKLLQTDIVQKKSGTYIVAESKEISTFFFGNMSFSDQVGDDFGSHGKTAQKSKKDAIAALIRDAKQPF